MEAQDIKALSILIQVRSNKAKIFYHIRAEFRYGRVSVNIMCKDKRYSFPIAVIERGTHRNNCPVTCLLVTVVVVAFVIVVVVASTN